MAFSLRCSSFFKGFNLPLVLGAEPFKLLLLFQDEHWLFIGIGG